jgi:chromosome partitioning protein
MTEPASSTPSVPTGTGLPGITRTIAFINQKGGVGKTTTAVNLAAGVARAGKRVLLIDLDPQAHATLHLGVETGPSKAGEASQAPRATHTVYDLLIDPDLPLAAALVETRENLTVVAAETDLAAAEGELAGVPDRLTRLRKKIEAHPRPFDFVMFDCPPSLGVLTLGALAAAREVFIPMQAHFLALQGVGKLMETVGLVGREVNPRLHVTGVVLCQHDNTSTHSKEVVADLDGFFAQARETTAPWSRARVYRPPVRRNIKLAECPSFGKTIFEYEPACPGAKDYGELADVLVREWTHLSEQARARVAGAGVGSAASSTASLTHGPTPGVVTRAAGAVPAGAGSGAAPVE